MTVPGRRVGSTEVERAGSVESQWKNMHFFRFFLLKS